MVNSKSKRRGKKQAPIVCTTVLIKDESLARWDVSTLADNPKVGEKKQRFYHPVKPGRVRRPASEVVKPIPHFVCIGCKQDKSRLVDNIRGRILRGYMVYSNGRLNIEKTPPNGGPIRPAFLNGRMCSVCASKFKLTDNAPVAYNTIQPIRDVAPVVHQQSNVTLAKILLEDYEEELDKAREAERHLPKVGNVNIPLDETQVKSNKKVTIVEYDGDGNEIGKVTTKSEPIHVNSFRKFMQSRGGGLKNYDKEINFSNQKKGK